MPHIPDFFLSIWIKIVDANAQVGTRVFFMLLIFECFITLQALPYRLQE